MTYFEAFDRVKKVFEGANTEKLTGNFAIQVNLTDDDCNGAFYIQYKDGQLNVEPYDYVDNNATVTASLDVLLKALASKVSFSRSVASGKIIVNGDIEVVKSIVDITIKPKAAPKKSETKKAKTEVKESPASKNVSKKKPTVKVPVAKKSKKK